jgi:hypothetical protein
VKMLKPKSTFYSSDVEIVSYNSEWCEMWEQVCSIYHKLNLIHLVYWVKDMW